MSSPRPRSERALGVAFALGAAVLFGFVNTAAKASLNLGLAPLWAVGLSYLAGGLLLAPLLWRTRIARADAPRFGVVVIAGAIAAPLLLYHGLARASAVDASLLLTLEMPFTATLAGILLGERARGMELAGLLLVAAAAVLVAVAAGSAGSSAPLGVALVGLAALGWAVDNAASTPLARRYRATGLIAWKTALGGVAILGAALALVGLPGGGWRALALAAGAGVAGVAVSSVLFYLALARIGATRTTVLFSTSALVGTAAGRLILGEPLTPFHGAAAVLAVAGIWLVARHSS